MPRVLTAEMFETLGREFRRIGFRFVAIDVDGYRTGALNAALTRIEIPSP
jgi:PP-loop superfamily ATP-utilizing enzyme